MDFLTDWLTDWLKELLIDGIMGNLSGLFDSINANVGEIAAQVGTTPAAWNAGVFSLIRQLSETVVLPIAGLILTFVATYELIQMLIDRNNLQYSHRELSTSDIPYFEDVSEKRELLLKSDALKKRQPDVAEYFAGHSVPDERILFVKSLFNNTYTEIILDSGQRVGYRAYDDVLHLWRGAYTSREQEEYLRWEDVASAIEGLMQDGLWAEPMEQLTLQVDVPEEPNQDEDYIPNLFDLAGSTIPLTSEPVESTVSIRPLVSQEVIDAALTLGANDRDSRLRIIAEFMKDKPLEENARFLQAHYKENGAGFYVGERKYSLWYDESGLRIAPGESAKVFTAAAVTWEQAAERIRELLDDGMFASQAMLYRAWPFENNRVAEALQYLHRDIDEDFKDTYLPTLTAALRGSFGYPDVVDKTKELLEQPEQLQAVIGEFTDFMKDYAHNRHILRFRHRPDEIAQGLQDMQCTPLKFTASPDFAPMERFFISQDEIDNLLREHPDRHDYRIGVYNFFQEHSDRKEREKYLSHLHGEYSGYHGGNDNITYTHKELTFTHGDITEPYAAVKMKWTQVRKRMEELIKKDVFLSPEDREIMESRTLEAPSEESTEQSVEPEPLSEQDAKTRDILMANTKAHFASYDEVKQARPSDIVLFQRGDFFEMYGPDARVASVELDIHLTNRNIPELGRVAMCGVPAKDLDKYVEKLRKEHGVTISAVPENGTERQIYFLPSYSDMSEDKSSPSSKEMESEQVVGAAPQMVPSVEEYARIKERFPDRVVGVQNGDTIYFYGTDAEKAGPALNRNVLMRDIPGMGAVSITGDAESWQASQEKLLRHGIDLVFVRLDDDGKYEVITASTAAEYIPVGMVLDVDRRRCRIESVDFQQDAVRLAVLDSDLTLTEPVSYVREYVEDAFTKELEQAAEKEGGKSFVEQVMEDVERLTEQAPTIRELYEKYKALVIEALGSDQLYRNACKNSDKDTAYLEGDAAIKRAVLAAGDDTLTKLYFDNSKFHNDLHREGLEETYPIFSEPAQPPIVRDEPSDEPSAVPQPRAPLAPAYQVGDTVYLDNTAFTITNIGLFDIQLQDPTLSYPIFRSESKANFEKQLRRDERNLPITDYLLITEIGPADNGDDLQDILTNEGGLLNEQAKKEVAGWLQEGVGNTEIARRLCEKYESTIETMVLETGEQVDYSIFSDRMTLDIQGKSRAVMMYDLRTVAGVLRAMYQQELGGFSHTPPAVEIIPASSAPQYTLKTESIYPAEKNNLPFDVVIETLHIDEPQRGPVLQNFHITDDNLGAGGAKAKYQMNMAALMTLHSIEAENRTATPEEQQTLSKYVGWGALADAFDESKPAWASEYKELLETLTPEEYESARASTLNSHYTSPTVIKAMYQALENMGFKGGNLLEPSCGVGNFFGLLPESMAKSKLYGVELDGLTGRIAQQLYPNAHIQIKGFENTSFQKNSFDLAIGNVPFGNYQVFDPAYNKLGFTIHNYFFAKTIDQVRPGGIIAFVTSRYTMDSKSTQAREYMAQRAELLGAVRLPNNAFLANAGTEVVADILFLQKRERPVVDLPDWVYTEKNADGYAINSYFIDHPEMVLGTETSQSTRYGSDYTVAPSPGADLGELLAEAITHIDGQYMEAETVAVENEKEQETLPADPGIKNFTYTIIKGDVYYRQDSVMVKMELGATATARTMALIDLRDCTQRLISEQLEGYTPEESIRHTQEELNRLYDNFAKRFGLINDKINERAFSQDSSYYLLCALEILDDEGKFVRKSDMFTKRTIYPHQEITHVDTATEALAVSLGERARVDIPFMAELTGKTEEEVISDLQGQIYRVPLKEPPVYQTADEYLSGNVREKLKFAEAAATADPTYNINVSALKAVQPKDLDASEIAVRLGTDWINQEYIEQFMHEVLKTPAYAREYVHVQYSPIVHAWNISNKTHIRKDDVAAHSTYGTPRVSAYKLLEDALNLQNTRVYDTVEDAEGNEKRVLNAKETTLAQQKQAMLKLEFQDWIWRDPDRREKLVRKYNDEMNCIRPREYDGSHLVLAGMNPEIQLEEHQKNAIARAVYGGNTLFAHCVGAGKTFEMTASAMEMKRLGLCSKSMIVVPNHLTQQWASEFLRLYPNANILVTTKRDFEKDRRKKFCSRIATGEFDAVIIGYSQFEKIPISKERQLALLHQQIDSIVAGIALAKAESGQHFTVKNLERTKRSLEDRLKKLQADHRKDTVINFEELGIDRLFVDESDSFKNLFLITKMQNVAGLSTSDAQKSSDMFNKTRYLDEITDYKGVIFATGTPISNSITEMYTVQRYLQYDALKAMHMEHFDSWASRFGETVTTMELAPEGTGYRPRERFAKFFNLPELMNIFHEVADIKTEDMLNLPTPDVEFHNIVAKPTEFQKAYVQKLSERATAVRVGNVDPTEDNMLKITNDGRKLGLDQRLISPLAEDASSSKINICVENIMKYWEDGKEEKLTQLVFSDLSTPKKDGTFNVYDDIKQKLIERGVPENEVAFIHDAESEVKKKELFSKVRSGKVRVLIGSTQKLGAGTNIQDRLIALHHLDVPWRPRDLTQREGRIKRRGNQNDVVHVFRYVTEGTFDAYLYQTVEKKQQFIGQIMTSKSPARTCDDVDEAALSYAEVKALCAGDPRIRERMELDVDVARLQVMQASHRSQQYNLEDKLRKYFPQEKQRLEWRIEGIQRDMATLAEHPLPSEGYIGIELLGQRFDERKAAGTVLLNECKKVQVYTTSPVGEYRGLKVFVKKQNMYSDVQIVLKGAVEYTFTASDSDIGNITRIDNALERLPEELEKAQASLENVKQQMESAQQEVGRPFPQEQELRDKLARIAELDIALKMADKEAEQRVTGSEVPAVSADEISR